MDANPIGLVVIAITTALVAAIIVAWQNSEAFRNVVISCWEAIKTAAGAGCRLVLPLILMASHTRQDRVGAVDVGRHPSAARNATHYSGGH